MLFVVTVAAAVSAAAAAADVRVAVSGLKMLFAVTVEAVCFGCCCCCC